MSFPAVSTAAAARVCARALARRTGHHGQVWNAAALARHASTSCRDALRPTHPGLCHAMGAPGLPVRVPIRTYTIRNPMTFYPVRASTPVGVQVSLYGVIVAVVGAAGLLYYAAGEPVVYTGRRRVVLLTREQELELQREMIRNGVEGSMLPPTDPRVQAVVAIAKRIAATAEKLDAEWEREQRAKLLARQPAGDASDAVAGTVRTANGQTVELTPPKQRASKWNWRVGVVDSDMVNAFCAPGGLIIVHRGLLDMIAKRYVEKAIQDPESAVAFVIAHEVSHAVARHGVEKLSSLPVAIAVKLLGESSPLLAGMHAFLYDAPYSRMLEREADTIGLQLLMRSCYPLSGAAEFFAATNNSTDALQAWISTHPADDERAATLAASAETLIGPQAARCGSVCSSASMRAKLLYEPPERRGRRAPKEGDDDTPPGLLSLGDLGSV